MNSGQRKESNMEKEFKKKFIISSILTVPILFLSPLIQSFLGISGLIDFKGQEILLFIFSSLIFFYGGSPFYRGMFREIKELDPGMMTLIGVAIITAYSYSSAVVFGLSGEVFFWELATLIDIMLFGHWMEMKSVKGASRALEELIKLMPNTANLVTKEGIKEVPIDSLERKDVVLVKSAEKIPADGVIVEGSSSIDESMITGESKPVKKEKGDEVIGGSVNKEGSLKVRVEKTGEDSYLSQVIGLVEEAQESETKTQNLANRAARLLTFIALLGGGLTFFSWFFLGNMDLAFSIERAVTVMVITCPHALGLAIPLVVAVSTTLAAQNGLLIRDRDRFEEAKDLNTVVFDKTGTLTKGEFGVTNVLTVDNWSKEDVLELAASLESHSDHPIAKGIVKEVEDKLKVFEYEEIPGRGVSGRIKDKKVLVSGPGFLEEKNLNIPRSLKGGGKGRTIVFVVVNGEVVGRIELADIIREESRDAISELEKLGYKCIMLTGDVEEVAKWVSEELKLDNYFSEVLPHEKSNVIKDLQKEGNTVAMTGDGVNDAPALATADLGIAIGGGTDVAFESADVVLVKNNPLDVVSLIKLSKLTYKKMVQNLFWATGYNAFAIPLAAGVLYSIGIVFSPAIGALLMSISTIIVAINAKVMDYED